ncbi:MAG: molybdopterin biosynthesis protein [Rhodospirillaceae bacterium]
MSEAERLAALWRAARQEQFLEVAGRDEAETRFRARLRLDPLEAETIALTAALGRVLADDVVAPVDVPGFDRAMVDGFAVRAADTAGAATDAPRLLRLNHELLTPGVCPVAMIEAGTATVIATGGMVPRGADAVVMIEDTEATETNGVVTVEVGHPIAPGKGIAAAGSDMACGETVLRAGALLGSREIGMLAAVGLGEVAVRRRPRVAILSTGDEIIAPGRALKPGQVHDSNAALLAAAVIESGGEPVPLGIVPDLEPALEAALKQALAAGDLVLLSGGTSKGAGDLAGRVVARLTDPGVIVHGVALKPGKPLCLAAHAGKPVVILPGFPTSAIFTFHEFVAPLIRLLGGRPVDRAASVAATLPVTLRSEPGRTEYVMVSLVRDGAGGLAAYPLDKGSGSVTSFARADGFVTVPAATEAVAAGTPVGVRLIGASAEPAELTIIGSHCLGLDLLITRLEREGVRVKALNVGSTGGLVAARRGECDLAGIHLLDSESGEYNSPFLAPGLALIPGWRRLQGLVYRGDDARFTGPRFTGGNAAEILAAALADDRCLMVNRNAGSGTRLLIDGILGTARPPGHSYQARSHNGVAAAVMQGRADWGVAIESVARRYGLGFAPLSDEHYDFVVPMARLTQAPVRRFIELMNSAELRAALEAAGFGA